VLVRRSLKIANVVFEKFSNLVFRNGNTLCRSIRHRTKCDAVEADVPLSPSILLSSPTCQAGTQKHSRDTPVATASDSVLSVCETCYFFILSLTLC